PRSKDAGESTNSI
ncbi:unnamed protein product, partial [Rotaria sp. Silwood1]